MYSKIALLSVLVVACHAALLVDNSHHQAVSSQSIIRHDQPTHQIATHQISPTYTHAVPIYNQIHSAPVVQHSTLLQHSAPIIQHSSPYIQHGAPLLQHSTLLQHSAPAQHVIKAAPVSIGHHQIEEHAPAHYEFSYSVDDPHTGDHKSQHESRDGDVVKGEYSLLQPDGSIRKVEYTADHHNGFNAIVHNSAPSVHAAPTAVHTVPVHAAPVAQAIYSHH